MKCKNIISLFFACCSFGTRAALIEGPGDSIGYMYPLSDPRNPECPCHRLQAKAELVFQAPVHEKPEGDKLDKKISVGTSKVITRKRRTFCRRGKKSASRKRRSEGT